METGTVFVAYARPDAKVAGTIVDALRQAGIAAWWDQDLHPGEEIRSGIGRRVREAAVVVVLWSEHTARRPDWVQTEADVARSRNTLLWVRLGEVVLPEQARGFRPIELADPTMLSPVVEACKARAAPPRGIEPLRRLGLLDISLRKGANTVGHLSGLLVLASPWLSEAPIWVDWVERLLILFGVAVIASSPYRWPGANIEPPEWYSTRLSAPATLFASAVAAAQLAWTGVMSDHTLHGLVMLGLVGAFLRIQPRTVE